jgi:hypothetical protein
MRILERIITRVERGRWAELAAIEQRFEAVERKYGFPPAHRYRAGAGGSDMNTMVLHREWESYAAREKAYESALGDSEWQKVGADSRGIIASSQAEFYHPMDLAELSKRAADEGTVGGRPVIAHLPGGMDVVK